MEDMVVNRSFWSGRRVFLTGHTGFKGSWLCIWLQSMGAIVHGFALKPPTTPSLFVNAGVEKRLSSSTEGDIRDLLSLRNALEKSQAEIVFHLAAQPLVRDSYQNPVETYATNVMGTVNILEALRSTYTVRAFLNVTTDKVYENQEWFWAYRESDRLGGYDPYSNSKACSELVTSCYRSSYFNETNYKNHRIAIATARAGNVIGGGDWASNRLVPDCIRAFSCQQKVKVRYPEATRPWQYVLDPLNGYLLLAQRMFESGSQFNGAWNFAPDSNEPQTVRRIVETAARLWGEGASFTEETVSNAHEAASLRLDSSKARQVLGWRTRWNMETTLNSTVQWFKAFLAGKPAYDLCISQISEFKQT